MSVIAACESCGETFLFEPTAERYVCSECLDAVEVAPECAWDDAEEAA